MLSSTIFPFGRLIYRKTVVGLPPGFVSWFSFTLCMLEIHFFVIIITVIAAAEKIWEKICIVVLACWRTLFVLLQKRNHNKWRRTTTWSKMKHKIVTECGIRAIMKTDRKMKSYFILCRRRKQTAAAEKQSLQGKHKHNNRYSTLLFSLLCRKLKTVCTWMQSTIEIKPWFEI